MGLYNQVRVLRHRATLDAIAAGHGTSCPPIHVRLEPTESCNFRCQFCIWHDEDRYATIASQVDMTGRRQLPRARILALVDELAAIGTQAISFTGVGDPLVYPYMAETLARIRGHGLRAGVTSNLAMRMPARTTAELGYCQWVRWSMNGGTEDVYQAIHRPRAAVRAEAFARARENVARVRAAMGDGARLNASFVVHEANQADVYAAARLARELGIASIAFRPDTPFDRADEPLRYAPAVWRELQRARSDFDAPGFTVHVNEDRLDDVRKRHDPDLVCFYSNHTTYIAANGDVYPCCYTRYDARYAIGNILEQEFADFWHSPARQTFYRRLHYDRCPSCPHGNDNRALQTRYEHGVAETEPPEAGAVLADPFV